METNGRTDGLTDKRAEAIAVPPTLMWSVYQFKRVDVPFPLYPLLAIVYWPFSIITNNKSSLRYKFAIIGGCDGI